MLDRIRKINWKKIFKVTAWSLLSLIVAANLYIVISGKFHLYKAISNTIFKGRLMPSIHEQHIFYNRTVKANDPQPWPTHTECTSKRLRPTDIEKFNSIETESFLIIKNDSLYFEKYWHEYNNHNEDSISNSFSVAKSVVSILVGVAIDEGKIKSLDDPVTDYLNYDDSWSKVSIRNLMNMASGMNWDESSSPLSDNTEAYYGWDLKRVIAKQEIETEPGQTFNYQSGNTQVVSFILEKATGKTVSEYASEKLWTPIGATTNALWNLDDENGHEKAFCCIYATARDFARIGQLYLNNGNWKGKQIVPEWYVKECLRPADIKTENGEENKKYGLFWWLDTYKGLDFFYARGILGQYIIVIPKYDLVIVRTGYERGEKLPTDHPEDLYWYIDATLAMINS